MPEINYLPVNAFYMGAWYSAQLGHGEPHPFRSSIDECAAYRQDCARLLYDAWGDIGFGSSNPQPSYNVAQHDGRIIAAVAYGSPYPSWDEVSGAFWLETNAHPWAGISSVAEVTKLPLPDWEQNPLVQENICKWQEYQARFGSEQARIAALPWTEFVWGHPHNGQLYRFGVVPTFLDLGSFLMGAENFLTILADDQELAQALLQKIFQISISQCQYMSNLYSRPLRGWSSMGGDNSCLVSAEMYRSYAMKFDRLVRAQLGPMPCNLHSCGASRHLYEVWGEYPDKQQIVLMQTRAIPGAMAPLRRALPDTFIELTVMQPQVDFERESPERIKALVWELAESLGFKEMSICVLLSVINEQSKSNILALREAGEEINRVAAQYSAVDR